ncbi:hypothetical protein MaudCBS49596_006882 [Microsporum audouinii]
MVVKPCRGGGSRGVSKVLFFELSDEFPCLADAEDVTVSDNFAEDIGVYPSRLEPEERDLVRPPLYRTILQLGFRSGVFHVEARVQNLTMRYKTTNGIVDLDYVTADSATPAISTRS